MNEFWKGFFYAASTLISITIIGAVAKILGMALPNPIRWGVVFLFLICTCVGLIRMSIVGSKDKPDETPHKLTTRNNVVLGGFVLTALIGLVWLVSQASLEYELSSGYTRPTTRCEQSQFMKETMIRNLNVCLTGEIICTAKQIESWETWVDKTSAMVDEDCGWTQ